MLLLSGSPANISRLNTSAVQSRLQENILFPKKEREEMWFYSTLFFGLLSSLCNGNLVLGRVILGVTRLNSQTVFSVDFKVAPPMPQPIGKRKENGMWLAHRKQNSKEIMQQNIFTILFLNKKGFFFTFLRQSFQGLS